MHIFIYLVQPIVLYIVVYILKIKYIEKVLSLMQKVCSTKMCISEICKQHWQFSIGLIQLKSGVIFQKFNLEIKT